MTTTTQDHITEENLIDAAARAAAEAGAKSLATLEPEQVKFTEHQVAILRQIGLEDATQGDLDLFFHVCRTTGLDPFRKQIYMIGRNTKVTEWVDDDRAANGRRKVEKWVTKYTIQTGIDGFRRNGREAAKLYGDRLGFDGPYWCGEDGEWREVWPAGTPPVAAKYTVFRNGEPFSAVVHYDEFVQTNPVYEGSGQQRKKVGEEPNSMWAKMPRNQTAKCAEAMAYRRAYPDDFSGLILEDSAQSTVIDQDGNVESAPPPRTRPSGRGGLRDRARAAEAERKQEPMDVEEVADPDSAPVEQPMPPLSEARQKLNGAMFRFLGAVGLTPDDRRADRLIVLSAMVDRKDVISSSNDLSDAEVKRVIKTLEGVGSADDAATFVQNLLDEWKADAARDAEAHTSDAPAPEPASTEAADTQEKQ